MAKKVIAVLVIFCFVALLATPAFATDDNTQQQKALIAVVGICALVGILFMLSRMGNKNNFSDSHLYSFLQNNSKKGFTITPGTGPQYQPPAFGPQNFVNPDKTVISALSVVYRW